jgi:hypothetical protein
MFYAIRFELKKQPRICTNLHEIKVFRKLKKQRQSKNVLRYTLRTKNATTNYTNLHE